MTTIDIIAEDDLLSLLRTKNKQGLITHLPINSEEFQNGISYKFRIFSNDEELKSLVSDSSDASVRNFSFSTDTDSKVFVTQQVNYNSTESYNPTQRQSELSNRTIYDLNSSEMVTVAENSVNEIYVSIPASLVGASQEVGPKISIREELNNSLIISNKDNFPVYMNLNFTDTPNGFYNFLSTYGAYELMVETFDKLGFSPERFQTISGDLEIDTLSPEDVLTNLTTNPSNFQLTHFPNLDISKVWGTEFDQIDSMIFQAELSNYIENQAPTYAQSLSEDKRPYVETICYQVIKYRGDSGIPLQTFYIPATDSNRYFIDNQVNFGDSYRYEVNSIGVVFYHEYAYANTVSSQGATISVIDRKMIKFVRLRLAESSHTIRGIAPTKPEIYFLNESNSNKKIRIYFEPDTHSVYEDFTHILDTDRTQQSNASTDSEGKIRYKLSKDLLRFQIFKTTKKPTSYMDFNNSLLTEVIGTDRSSSEVHMMDLTPNMKHYFTFRAKNNFNLFSNPTPIYEVELIRDSDETRIVSKIVNLEEEGNDRQRDFGRFLRIYPAFEQLLLREFVPGQDEASENTILFNNKQFYVGTTEDPIWGKKFKFRIRSKNTGKILDINLDFVLNKKDSEADF